MSAVRGEDQHAAGTGREQVARPSTFMPSGKPFLATDDVTSANSRPGPIVPSSLTGKAIQMAFFGSELATYSVFSSGESAMPLGKVISLVSSVTVPSLGGNPVDAVEVEAPWPGRRSSRAGHRAGR